MHFEDLVERLEKRLRGTLPGADAHRLLAPEPRRQWPPGFNPESLRHAAGLVLIFPIAGRPHIVLTLRAGTLGRHSGQVSLPGGVIEPGETFEEAALREAHEEVSLPIGAARVLGRLSPLDIPVSGFRLHPVVAEMATRPALAAADGEVAAILEVPIEHLLDTTRIVKTEREREGQQIVVPAFCLDGFEIWGATAMVLAEFAALAGESI